jgi:hypothetical protein
VDELFFMNFFAAGLLQAAAQAFRSSFLPAKTVTTTAHDPTTNPQQPHVLRTKPDRGSMPAERTATTTASVVAKKKRENHIGRWLDKHDHMASGPIEVRSCS